MSEEKDTAVSPEVADEQPKDESKAVEKNSPRPKTYILVNHMMHSAHTGTKRHMRSGNRRQGVILDNGQRLRRRGYRLMNEVNLLTMVKCHRRLLDYLDAGIIQAVDPETRKVMTTEQVIAKIEEVGSRLTPGEGKMKVDWKPDSTQPNMEAMKELAQTPEATGEDEEPPQTPEPENEVIGNGEPEEGITEEELMKLSRADLNDTAREYGVEDPESLKNKQEVVDAIFAAQAGEEG